MPVKETDTDTICSQDNTPLLLLFVDDEPILLDLATAFLQRTGKFQVITSLSAKDALQKLAKHHFDAVIADYEMPDMDGVELLKQIRKQQDTIPFILFTGRGREEVAIEALNHWADFYLQKGADPKSQFSELTHKVLTAVERRRYQEEIVASHAKLSEAYEKVSLREQELRLSEQKYRELFHAMKEGVLLHQIIYDDNRHPADYRILDGNDAVQVHTGMPIQMMIGKKASDIYETNPAPYLDIYSRVAETGEPISFETYFEPMKRYFSISVFSPRHGYFATVFTDITARKISEEKLHEMNEVFAQAQHMAHIGSWVYDFSTDQIICSEEIHHIFGFDSEKKSLTLDNMRACMHPNDAGRLDSVVKIGVEAQEWQPDVFRLLLSDGSIRYLTAQGKTEHREPENRNRRYGVIQDITKTKESELLLVRINEELNSRNEALAASYEEIAASEEEIRSQMGELYSIQERLRQSQHHLTLAQRVGKTGSFEITLDSGEITGSEVFFEIYGIPWISSGKVPYDLFKVCTSSFDSINFELALLITEDKPFNREFNINPANNTESKVVKAVAQVIKNQDGTPERVVGVIHDITEEKHAQVHLQETKEYLENLISHANSPIIAWNISYEITECNHACEIMTGLSRDEMIST